MNNQKDLAAYSRAVKELASQPMTGSSGTYHVKNGVIYCGYVNVPVTGFSISNHFWEIMH